MPLDFTKIKLYKGTTFADLLKEIHVNQQGKEAELKKLISDLKPFLVTAGDAIILVPLIKDYLNTSVKNDENLIKMATIVQRAIMAGSKDDEGNLELSDREREQLMEEVKQMKVV